MENCETAELLEAAKVERNVSHLCDKNTGKKPVNLPVTYALELGKLPTPELQAKAYDEAVQAATILRQWAKVEPTIAINNTAGCVVTQLESGISVVKLPRHVFHHWWNVSDCVIQRQSPIGD